MEKKYSSKKKGDMGRDSHRRRQRSPSESSLSDDGGRNSRRGFPPTETDRRRASTILEIQREHRASGRVLEPLTSDFVPRASFRPSAVAPTTPAATTTAAAQATPAAPAAFKPIFVGLLAAPVSPMLPNGDIDLDAIAEYAEALKADGVAGVFCNGTTGESMSLSVRERKAMTERWMATGLKVCAHIGAQSLPETRELAAHAQSCGVHAVAVICPSFFKPASVSDVVDFLQDVSNAAPAVPLLVYHFPGLTGIPFRLSDILAEALRRGTLPNLRGAKYTSPDLGDFTSCLQLKGPITELLYAQEPNIAGATFIGATAFVGRDYSYVGPLYNRVLAAASKGDVAGARALQGLVASFLAMFSAAVGGSVEKGIGAAKVLTGLRLQRDVGPPRAPVPRLSVIEKQKLSEGMAAFVKAYAAETGKATTTASAAAAAPAIDVKAMPGFKGELDDAIGARVAAVAQRIGVRGLAAKFPHLGRRDWRGRLPTAHDADPAAFVDHTLLVPEGTAAGVTKLCKEARDHNFFAVCVNGSRVAQCVDELRGSRVKVAAVIGFPLGAGTPKAKGKEAAELVKLGCAEIDMVMNIGAFKDGNYRAVYEDIAAVVEASAPAIVKVIFETCLLSREETIDACILSVAAGAAFVKTSTGFNKGGATPEAIDAMLATVGNEAQVKASGGVRDRASVLAYITAGVRRIGTSSGVAIVAGKPAGSGY